ncbi:ras and EF-hand domain-containing protein homolog isoform X7 [Clytia hemisphaerica]|uniref:ras and EF-hand domain-containing protein homolog isoform X7 n=1 Tax=Clytia hemisphaerica TaxID=252671 RepID=UPI0034D5A43B
MIENDPSEHLTLPKPPKPAQSHHNNRPLHKNNNAEDENDPELQVIREFLNTANLDSSGFIDETELAAVVDLSPDEIRQIFWTLDNDGDGKISIEQFTHYYKTLQEKQDVNENELPPADNAKPMPAHHQDMTRDSFRDSGYSMSEPTHRKKKHPTTLSPKTQKDAAKYLGQEYLDDLYEVARSRDDPLLLESLENFLSATVDNLLKKQADNERLDAALKHAKDQNTEIAAQIEDEMEEQVAIMEEKIRQEEEQKLTQQKQEAHAQLQKANDELGDMEHKIIALEEKLNEQKIKEASIPDHFIDKIQRKEQENQQLQAKLLEFHTQMSLMRTEVAALKSEYDEQSSRLHNERGTVLSCVREQENLTRQLQMLHEANKRLHDTNDDLRSALDVKRSNSFMNESSISPLKRSQSFAHQQNPLFKHDLQSSFRSDPGYARHHSTLNNTDFNDTDDDSRQSFSRDDDVIDDLIDNDDVINQQSLMAELMSAEDQAFDHPPRRRTGSALSNLSGSNLSNISEREQFAQQLEMLAETNRRLGESNDDLRNALSLLTDHVRSQSVSERSEGPLSRRDGSERSDILTSRRESPPGCYSTPSTPLKSEYTERPRPNSTSSPRKVILTKSGYHSYDDTTNDFTTDPTATQNMTEDMSKSSAFGYPYDRQKPSPVSKRLRLLHNLESEMSMLSTSEISEDELENSDNDSVDDEELIRLVDQAANEETGSITDEPITVEEKILDVETVPRGPGVGADTSSESGASVGDVSSEPDEMFKLVLAGNAAVGKSSFILRLCKNKFYSALNATLGVDFQMKRMIVDKKKIALQCWDTAGQERFRSIAKSYFRRVDGVVLLYDVTCENSFLDVREWIESIESSSDNVPVILCGNKVDLRPDAERIGMPVISRDQGQQLAKDVGALFIETSAKEGTNIHRACKDLIRMMQRNENPKPHPNGTVQLDPESEKPKKAGCCGKS